MTLFEAKPYDAAAARRKRLYISIAVAVLIVVLGIVWHFRYWPEESVVDHFFGALQQQNYEQAYGIWMHDPDWKQHPDRYSRYTYNEFIQDWGPGGEWGIVKSHSIDGAAVPKGGNGTSFDVASSGVVVVVTVNDRVAKAHIWVEKADKTLAFSPY